MAIARPCSFDRFEEFAHTFQTLGRAQTEAFVDLGHVDARWQLFDYVILPAASHHEHKDITEGLFRTANPKDTKTRRNTRSAGS